MTANLKRLLDDASATGYEVKPDGPEGEGWVIIKHVRINQHKVEPRGLWICGNGTAIRLDVDLTVAAGIRSYKDMRAVLGIA